MSKMDKVIVYTNPNCVQCDQTKKFLDRESIEYEVKDLTENKDDLVRFINMGFKSAPIVETEDDIWSGFKIDKLKTLAVRRSQ
jgi:glutaredoxin-like protein NrdH